MRLPGAGNRARVRAGVRCPGSLGFSPEITNEKLDFRPSKTGDTCVWEQNAEIYHRAVPALPDSCFYAGRAKRGFLRFFGCHYGERASRPVYRLSDKYSEALSYYYGRFSGPFDLCEERVSTKSKAWPSFCLHQPGPF